jgi:hypothetical protein
LNLQSSHLEPLAQSPNNLTGRNKTHAARRYISPFFTFAARKANDAPRVGRRQAIIAKLPPTDCVTNALLPDRGAAWSLPIPIISHVHVVAANWHLRTRARAYGAAVSGDSGSLAG